MSENFLLRDQCKVSVVIFSCFPLGSTQREDTSFRVTWHLEARITLLELLQPCSFSIFQKNLRKHIIFFGIKIYYKFILLLAIYVQNNLVLVLPLISYHTTLALKMKSPHCCSPSQSFGNSHRADIPTASSAVSLNNCHTVHLVLINTSLFVISSSRTIMLFYAHWNFLFMPSVSILI